LGQMLRSRDMEVVEAHRFLRHGRDSRESAALTQKSMR